MLVMYGQVLHNLYSITSLTLYSLCIMLKLGGSSIYIYISPQQASLQS